PALGRSNFSPLSGPSLTSSQRVTGWDLGTASSSGASMPRTRPRIVFCSGDSGASGTLRRCLQFGQAILVPAADTGFSRSQLHLGQENWIISSSSPAAGGAGL